jgi:hypothetical protein
MNEVLCDPRHPHFDSVVKFICRHLGDGALRNHLREEDNGPAFEEFGRK